MNYLELSSQTKREYAAQCRTLIQVLTGIRCPVEFADVNYPAAMQADMRTNRQERMIINEQMPVDSLAGLVIHECGHILGTDPAAFEKIGNKCEGKTTTYINIVEDYRVDYGIIANYFPWATQYIQQTCDILAQEHPPTSTMPSNIVNVLFKQQLPIGAPEDRLADARAYVEEWGPVILSSPTTASLEKAALALQALDKKYGEIQPPDEQMTDEEKQRMKKVYGKKGDKLSEMDAKEAKAKAKAEGPGDKPKKGNQRNDDADSSSLGDDEFHLRPVDRQAEGFDQALTMLSGMRNRLHEAIVSSDFGAPLRYTKKGQLDCRRIAYAPITERVFQQPFAAQKRVNTAIDLVIDCSGSMSSNTNSGLARAHVAAATAYMLGQALCRIDGTQVGVMLYDGDCYRVHDVKPMRTLTRERAQTWASAAGGTDTDGAVAQSLDDLLQCKTVRRRMCIVITDDEAVSEEQIHACNSLDVEAYCLCIDSSRDDAECVKHTRDVMELPSLVTQIVQRMFAESRHAWVA